MVVLTKVTAKRTKSAATANVFTDQVVSVNTVRLILIALSERVVVCCHVSPVQVVSVNTVRLILTVLAERVVVGSHVSPVQVVSVNTVRLIPIAEVGEPVVTGLARTYMTVVLILPQS